VGIEWEYVAIAASLAIYVVSVVEAYRSVSRRRLWKAPPRRRVASIKR